MRLKFVGVERAAVFLRDAIDLAVVDVDARRLGRVIRLRTGAHIDVRGALLVGPNARPIAIAFFRISGPAELSGDAAYLRRLAYLHRLGRGVDLCRVCKNRTAQALVDDLLIFDVVVRKDPEQDSAYDDESGY